MGLFRRKSSEGDEPPAPGTIPGTSLVSSAVLVSHAALMRVQRNAGWQAEAWGYYDRCSTLRVAVNWLGSACSRATLFIAEDDPAAIDEPTQVDDAEAENVLSQLSQGRGNANLLRTLGIHMSVTGESYVTGYDDPATDLRKWQPLSADDLKINGDRLTIDQGDGVKLMLAEGQYQIVRCWRPHPRWSAQSDSPVRALGPDLAELVGLSQHVLATIDSRLAGNGLLAVPESVTTPPIAGQPLHDDPLMAALIEAMTTPIQDRDNAAAVVPLLLRVPDEAAGKLQYLRFGTDFDARIPDMRKSAIERVASGIELPTAIVSGLEDANHWSAWAISEDAVKVYVNPLVALICDALTQGYLRPALKALGHPEWNRRIIWYDTSDLVLRPDRSNQAVSLFDRGLLSDESTRRENGFSETDAPSAEEYTRYLLLQLAKAFPAIAPQVANELDSAVDIQTPAAPAPPTAPPQSSTPADDNKPATPAPADNRQIPQQRDSGPPTSRMPTAPGAPPAPGGPAASVNPGAVRAYAELGVLRALEAAGTRLLNSEPRSKRGQFSALDRWDLHTKIRADDPDKLLDRAFSVLDRVLPDMPCVGRVCAEHTRRLIETQTAYDRVRLFEELGPCLDDAA